MPPLILAGRVPVIGSVIGGVRCREGWNDVVTVTYRTGRRRLMQLVFMYMF